MSLYDYGSDDVGLHFTITTSVNAQTGLTDFTVNVITGSLNLNAVYWSNGDDFNDTDVNGDGISNDLIGFTGAKSENSLNMNGSNVVWNDDGTFTTAKEVYDGGIKLSDAGLGKTLPATYLTANGEYTFSADVDLSLFSTLGVRATSTSTAEGSIKWVDNTPYDPPPPDDALRFDGLSAADYASTLPDGTPIDAGQWWGYTPSDNYEAVFGVNSVRFDLFDAESLMDIVSAGAHGGVYGFEGVMAQQAVTALLNVGNGIMHAEPTMTQHYRFDTTEIVQAVQKIYANNSPDGSFTGMSKAMSNDLSDLLSFWNTAAEHNIGPGAHVPGELHSNDSTTIATTLIVDTGDPTEIFGGIHHGGSFEGNIFAVLNTLHPDHGWL